jgi:alpha-L-arabinofuranosidase
LISRRQLLMTPVLAGLTSSFAIATAGRVAPIWVDEADHKGVTRVLTLSVVNLRANDDIRLSIELQGATWRSAQGRTVTAPSLDAHPDFGLPDPLQPRPLSGISLGQGRLAVTVPARSVSVVEVSP